MRNWNADLFERLVHQEFGSLQRFAAAVETSTAGVKNWMPPTGPTGDRLQRVATALNTTVEALTHDDQDAADSPVQLDRMEGQLRSMSREIVRVRDALILRSLQDRVPGVLIGSESPVTDENMREFLVVDEQEYRVVGQLSLAPLEEGTPGYEAGKRVAEALQEAAEAALRAEYDGDLADDISEALRASPESEEPPDSTAASRSA